MIVIAIVASSLIGVADNSEKSCACLIVKKNSYSPLKVEIGLFVLGFK